MEELFIGLIVIGVVFLLGMLASISCKDNIIKTLSELLSKGISSKLVGWDGTLEIEHKTCSPYDILTVKVKGE